MRNRSSNLEPFAVDAASAAELIHCSKSFLDKLRLYRPKESPPFVRAGRRVLYPMDGLRDWLANKAGN